MQASQKNQTIDSKEEDEIEKVVSLYIVYRKCRKLQALKHTYMLISKFTLQQGIE